MSDKEKDMKIIKSIVAEFTKKNKVPFIFEFETMYVASAEITLPTNKFVKNSIVNLTPDFYLEIHKIADKKGVILSFNNTGSTFWIKK